MKLLFITKECPSTSLECISVINGALLDIIEQLKKDGSDNEDLDIIVNKVSALKIPDSCRWWEECLTVSGVIEAAKDDDIDLIVSMGGDGTLLHCAWEFQSELKPNPPIIPIHFGSLGFLNSFRWAPGPGPSFFSSLIRSILYGNGENDTKGVPFNISERMRLRSHIIAFDGSTKSYNTLNEVCIDRGISSLMLNLDLLIFSSFDRAMQYIADGDGDLSQSTKVSADGLIISTPTGSTAYNLSAGGSIVHHDVNAILLTPICPHSLSFRPLILPSSQVLLIKLQNNSRLDMASLSFDGRERISLGRGDYLVIEKSPLPIRIVNDYQHSSISEWTNSLGKYLHWNVKG